MKTSLFSRGASPVVIWLGLAWVWSGVFWLLGVLSLAGRGWLFGAIAMAVRLVATLVLGVGLCATERWAWAGAVCLTALHAALGGGLAAWATHALVTLPPGVYPWRPLFLGLSAYQLSRILYLLWLAPAAAAGILLLLWRYQAQYDVPFRRAFTLLVRRGLGPATLVLLLDLYLLAGWWLLLAQ